MFCTPPQVPERAHAHPLPAESFYNRAFSLLMYSLLFFGTVHAVWFGYKRAEGRWGCFSTFVRRMYYKFLSEVKFLHKEVGGVGSGNWWRRELKKAREWAQVKWTAGPPPSFAFMDYEEMEAAQQEFLKTVFVHLPPGPDLTPLDDALWGVDSRSFTFVPSSQPYVECFAAYRVDSKRGVHFTSLQSLAAILNSYIVRLGSLTGMNDPKEFVFAAEDHDESLFRLASTKDRTYALSMCEHQVLASERSLDLRRLYGNEGKGVAIEFSVNMSLPLDDFLFGRIHYGKLDYTDFLTRADGFAAKYGRVFNKRDVLNLSAYLHKSSAYASENEIRLVRLDGDDPKTDRRRFPVERYLCDFNRRGELTNYFSLPLQSKSHHEPKLRIERIQFGFAHDQAFMDRTRDYVETRILTAQRERGLELALPVIELSPLTNIYK